jgi:hypothetical protein
VLEKILLAMIAGLFGLLPALMQFLSQRASARSHNNHIARLMSELEFLERVSSLSKGAESPRLDVNQDAARILGEYRALREGEAKAKAAQGPVKVSFVRRLLLLFTPPTATGWVLHTVFYVLLIFIGAMLISDYQNPTYDPTTGENEFIYLVIGIVVIFGPILFFLRRAAVRQLDRHARPSPAT